MKDKVKYHDDGKNAENDYYQKQLVKHSEEMKSGCLFSGLILLITLILLVISLNKYSNDNKWDYNDPKAVIKRERISDTDTSEVWRNVTYELVSVSYDTVPKVRRERSTIEPEILAPKVQTIPKDRVDLNDYLGDPDDGTDWNYTEIDEEAEKYLDDLGIYWDSDKEYWRKR